MGLLPDMLPGYTPLASGGSFGEYTLPEAPGLDLLEMFDAANAGDLSALYVVAANPVARYQVEPTFLRNTFLIVQDMFLTETAFIADVVLPAANAYEKSGTFTNTCGDLQLVKKAGEVTDTKSDFEMIVRVADAMGFDGSHRPPGERQLRRPARPDQPDQIPRSA